MRGGRTSLWENVGVSGAIGGIATGLVLIAAFGTIEAIVAVGVAAYCLLLALIGAERTAIVTLMVAYALAPAYKGFSPSLESPITAPDGLLVIGFGLMVPQLIMRRAHLPVIGVVGVMFIFFMGLISSSLVSDQPGVSLLALALWMMVMAGLPLAFSLWGPSSRVVDLLAWSYVVGQCGNTAYAFIHGEWAQGRYAGFSQHPNYFAQAGLMALALTIYLFFRYQDFWLRTAVLGAAAICGVAVVVSGSRAATVVAAVLFLMVPVVERSAVIGFFYAIAGALAIVLVPVIAGFTGEQSAFARLAGNTNSSYSDQARTEGINDGLDRFFAHPFTGDGLVDLFEIHNNMLEVLVATGVFGLVGFLMVLYTFASRLFSTHPQRRLAYVAWAYIGFGATVPSLYDRSIWLPLALTVVTFAGVGAARETEDPAVPVPSGPRAT